MPPSQVSLAPPAAVQPRDTARSALCKPPGIRSRSYGSDAENAKDIRPLSPLVPLQCLVHLTAVREWNARWLWE